MNVALIDDGVEINDSTIKYVKEFLEVCDSNKVVGQRAYVDPYSHGTICASIIRKVSKDSNIYSLKILNSNNLSSGVDKLEAAFKWCLEHDIDIINLSLGTINSKEFIRIEKWARYLVKSNKLIVAAVNNNNTYTLPASLPMVIGVSSNKLYDYYKFVDNSNIGIDIYSPSNHSIIINGEEFMTPFCNSFAAPAVTGMICRSFHEECTRKEDRYFFNYIKYLIRDKKDYLDNDLEYSMVNYNLNYKDLGHDNLKRKKLVPIINLRCNEDDLLKLNKLFFKDNIFPVRVENRVHIKRRLSHKMLNKISEEMGCDLIIIYNSSEIGKEDIFIDFTNSKFNLYYKSLFTKVICEYQDIKSLYDEMLILLE